MLAFVRIADCAATAIDEAADLIRAGEDDSAMVVLAGIRARLVVGGEVVLGALGVHSPEQRREITRVLCGGPEDRS